MKKIIFAGLFALNILYSYPIRAEEAVSSFEEDWALNFFGYSYQGVFSPEEETDYRTLTPAAGLGIRYKNRSAQIAMPLVFNTGSLDFEMNSYFDTFYYEAFFKRYKKLTYEKTNEDSGLDIVSSGIMTGWIYDHENHSLSSVMQLDKRQNVSGGSLLYGFGLFYSSLHTSNAKMKKYSERQHLLYAGPNIGYSYTWVYDNGLFLNLAFSLMPNWGIAVNSGDSLFILQPQPKIVFGYHAAAWSCNFKLVTNSAQFVWSSSDFNDNLAWTTLTLMFSKRF